MISKSALKKWGGISIAPIIAQLGLVEVASAQGGLGEITVTARKRAESLQESPISIQAFTAEAIERRNITDVSQIGEFTPNLVFDRAAAIGGSNSSAVAYIRGIGQDTAIPTIDLGVGTYIDGVYLARAVGGVVDLVDVEQIEVLRGPQGTLFGRNTIGGAINITSKKPSEEFGGEASVAVGDDERLEGRLSVNVPLADQLFAKASVLARQRDGYVIRPDGTDLGNEEMISGRLALRWLAADNLEFNFAADITSKDENGAPFVLIDVEETAAFTQFYNAFIAPPGACFPPPSSVTDPRCSNSQWLSTSGKNEFGTEPAKDELDIWGVALTGEWQVSDWLTLKSITSYRDTESVFSLDEDHTPHSIASVITDFTQEQFSEEIQFLGTAWEERLNWLVGLYYFQEEGETFESIVFSPVSFRSGGVYDNDSIAVFAQGTFDITDQLSLTAGVRYTEDTKRFTPDQVVFSNNNALVPPFLLGFGPGLVPPSPPSGTPILPPVEAKVKFTNTSPMVNLAYEWTPDFMTYATYSQGYKSGGFTQRIFPPLPAVPSYKPEEVEVVELGFKWTGFDNSVRINGAVFNTDYSDLQIVVQDVTVAPVVRNAGAATIRGFELDVLIAPNEALLIEGGLGFLDAEYDAIDPSATVSVNNKLVKTPKWSVNGAVSYTFDLASLGGLTPRFDWSFRDAVYNNAINSPQIKQDSYHLINAGLTFESENGLWVASLLGKNLTGEQVISAGFSDVVNLGVSEVIYSRKQEWVLSLKRRF